MARNQITNPRTLRRLQRESGIKIAYAMTRGGTNHRYDLRGTDGAMYSYFRGEKPFICAPQAEGEPIFCDQSETIDLAGITEIIADAKMAVK